MSHTFLGSTFCPSLEDVNEFANSEGAKLEKHSSVTVLVQYLQTCVLEIRRLQHELNDPNYMYAGSRICRLALDTRVAEIDLLRNQVKEQKAEILKLKEGPQNETK